MGPVGAGERVARAGTLGVRIDGFDLNAVRLLEASTLELTGGACERLRSDGYRRPRRMAMARSRVARVPECFLRILQATSANRHRWIMSVASGLRGSRGPMFVLSAFYCAVAVGCSGSDQALGSGLNTTGAASTGSSTASGSTAGSSGTTSGTTSGTSTTASFDGGSSLQRGPIGEETECNGVDDDDNGIIDDVDLGGDGVCDCLKIATIGTSAIVGPGDVFSTWLNERGTEAAASLSADSFLSRQQVTAEALAGYQVLVVQNLSKGTPYSQAEIDAIEAWVRNGGGLIALLGYGGAAAEQTHVNAVLEPLGVQFGSQSVLFGGLAGTLPIETWYDHPVSEGLERVGFNNGNEALGAGTVVAERDGITALRAHQVDQGRVLLWGDEWVTINSEWDSQPTFDTERFWLNVLKWLSPPTECQVPVILI